MSLTSSERSGLVLDRLRDASEHQYEVPVKRINDGEDLMVWQSSKAYADLTIWLLQLDRATFPSIDSDGNTLPCQLESPRTFSTQVENTRQILASVHDMVQRAPPDTGPRRFGNVAFRHWYQLVKEHVDDLLALNLGDVLGKERDSDERGYQPLNEVKAYLMGSFGSSQRLDYGTGHELSFLAFLGCLWKLGVFQDGEERAIVTGIIQLYVDVVRNLITTYTLEPAGSHGVWGLDDHSFLPYIFGSAQLGPPIPEHDKTKPIPTEGSLPAAPSPASVIDRAIVADLKNSNMYFSAIQFIYDVKKGPFWEHSPVLYDISGIKDGWGKINKGMLKMYAAEVLGKFPVVQHFPFGSLFRWERDPNAPAILPDIHTQQQPSVQKRANVVPGGAGAGTAAPWARSVRTSIPQTQVRSGLPSSRMPQGPSANAHSPLTKQNVGSAATVRSTATTQQQQPSGDVMRTSAPWAREGPT